MEEPKGLAAATEPRRLYEIFVRGVSNPKHQLPWEELPPIVRNGWLDVWIWAEQFVRDKYSQMTEEELKHWP